MLVAALEIAGGVALTALLLLLLVLRRARRRSRRHYELYELYELHLSTHDQAKPQDLEDMVESIANIIRAFPAERVRDGQPYVALELICGQGEGTEWSVNAASPPRSARWTRRSAPPTPTCASDASTQTRRAPARGWCECRSV